MRIAYVTAGAAGMYCGTCLHDNTLASALMARGHEVSLLPTYTPTRTDERNVAGERIFFGALNVYLQQKLKFFRHTPAFVDRLFDNPRLLSFIGRIGASSTDARRLGELTLSTLQGADGYQAKELAKLTEFVREYVEPEVIHLSHTLFAGFARPLKAATGVPVVCSLQGEDLFFEEMVEPFKTAIREELGRRLVDVDLFVAPCRYYAEFMSEAYGVPAERTVVSRMGIEVALFQDRQAIARPADAPPVVGFLARNAPEKGLHLLVDAFRLLAAQRPAARLRVAGYQSPKDRAYIEKQRAKIAEWGLQSRVDWVGEVDRQGKADFLVSLDVLCVPTTYREPKGLFVAEALASGVPFALPNHGSFPEWLEWTGGGVLFEPHSPPAIAEALRDLLDDPARRRELGTRGREAVRRDLTDQVMADDMLGLYERIRAR